MRNEKIAILLIVILVVTATMLCACNPTIEYYTVTVEGFTVPNHVYEFKVIKGERFTLSQVFHTVSHGFLSDGMDLYALTYKDGKIYDERQPVESDLQLLAISGTSFYMAHATIEIKGDRLKELCEQKGIDKLEAETFLFYGVVDESQVVNLFDLDVTDLQFALGENTDEIYDNFEQVHEIIFSFLADENDVNFVCGDEVYCSPNLHYHMPDVKIYLY